MIYLPTGYSALFRHADGELNYCVYLIPGNPKINMDKDLPHWHNYLMTDDENIKKAFVRTDDIERMKAGKYLPYNIKVDKYDCKIDNIYIRTTP